MAIEYKSNKNRRYVARDFDSFRAELLNYARQYYPNQIQDFSEASVGGLFLDMAAYIGDNLSFYLDHVYGELNSDTAVEADSIERALLNSGVKVAGAAPAVVYVTIFIEVPAKSPGDMLPNISLLPTVKEGTTFLAENGVIFNLIEDITFAIDPSDDGNYILNPKVQKQIGKVRSDGKTTTYLLSLSGLCVSGQENTEVFSIGSFIQFRKLTLAASNIYEIIKVYDDNANIYYEVGALSHDVVYKNALNLSNDSSLVKDGLRVLSAPFRFTKSMSLTSRLTTLTFGGGNAESLEDDIIPDPSEFAIAFPYSKTISRIAINPEKLLKTNTLGIASDNTSLTVVYRSGGGLNHNVAIGGIRAISNLLFSFPMNPSNTDSIKIRNTLEATNLERGRGGEDALTSDELVALIPTVKNSQERIVTKEDLLARVYTMPANFGRVFRAAITPDQNNPLATQLYIISRNSDQILTISPDTLKLNLKKYLNSYRMISDAIDILDAKVINLQLKFSIVVDPSLNRMTILSNILTKLQNQFNIKKMYIDQPIIISDVVNIIFTVPGVIAVDNIRFVNISGNIANREYSNITHNVKSYTKRQMIFPPPGGIFEIRYPNVDIIAKVVT